MASEGGEVVLFVVGFLIVPEAPEDADPFKGQGAQYGVVRFAGPALLSVKGVNPVAIHDGLARPFNEALTQELWRGPAPVRPTFPTALFAHRGHTGEFLQGLGGRIALQVVAEGNPQSQGERRPGSRQRGKQLRTRVRREDLGNARLQSGNMAGVNLEQIHQQRHLQHSGCDDSPVLDEWSGPCRKCQPCGDPLI